MMFVSFGLMDGWMSRGKKIPLDFEFNDLLAGMRNDSRKLL